MTLRAVILAAVVSGLALGCGDPPEVDDDAAVRCTAAADCDDGLFCNGEERCAGRAPGADVDGCAPAEAAPCTAGACSEETDTCVTECPDADGDGHPELSCGGDDCDDADPARFPDNPEVCDALGHDEDCDDTTFGDRDGDADGFVSSACCNLTDEGDARCGDDCDDGEAGVHPTEGESCNGLDDDCDGALDEGATRTFYLDADGDDFGDPSISAEGCTRPDGATDTSGDCDDTRASVYGGAREVCDGLDNDCDDLVDEGIGTPWFRDRDGDGYGDDATMSIACVRPVGHAARGEDCDDESPAANPGVVEICNGVDDDCDGALDAAGEDADDDGHAPASCGGADCDDADPTRYPGAPELCDAKDNDCDVGTVPSDDRDGDGHVPVGATCAGGPLAGAPRDDCDEANPARHGGATEVCNAVDDDCDDAIDGAGATAACRAAAPGTDAECVAGTCAGACIEGRLDCSDAPGCESDEAAPETCGSCALACVPGARCVDSGCSPRMTFQNEDTTSVTAAVLVDPVGGCHTAGLLPYRVYFGTTRLQGDNDVFEAAFDEQGDLRWARGLSHPHYDRVYALAYDASADRSLLGGSAGTATGSTALIAVRDRAGALIADRTFGAGSATAVTHLAVRADGSYLAAGIFSGSISIGAFPLTGGSFIAGFGADGAVRFARAFPAGMQGLGVDALGRAYVAVSASVAFDAGGGTRTPGSGGTSLLVASYDGVTGAHRWSRFEPFGVVGRVEGAGAFLAVRDDGPCWLAYTGGLFTVGGTSVDARGMRSVLACFDDAGTYAAHQAFLELEPRMLDADGDQVLVSASLPEFGAPVDLGTGVLPQGGLLASYEGTPLAIRWSYAMGNTYVEALDYADGRVCLPNIAEIAQ